MIRCGRIASMPWWGLPTTTESAKSPTRSTGHSTTRLSPPMSPGRNLQISRKDEQHIYVPQPQRGKVAVLDLATMRQVDEFDAGPAPAYLSEDGGMRVLLALSADGRRLLRSTNTVSGNCRPPRSPVILGRDRRRQPRA